MADVFISYSKHDEVIPASLGYYLKARGYDVWWDSQLYAGDDFHDVIRKELSKAKAAIVLWSEWAVASQWVRGEAQEAFDTGKIIAVHVEGFIPRDVPLNFRNLHTVSVDDRAAICRAIERKGGRPIQANKGDSQREIGTVISYDDANGIGLIRPISGGKAIYFYRAALEAANISLLTIGDPMSFIREDDMLGRGKIAGQLEVMDFTDTVDDFQELNKSENDPNRETCPKCGGFMENYLEDARDWYRSCKDCRYRYRSDYRLHFSR